MVNGSRRLRYANGLGRFLSAVVASLALLTFNIPPAAAAKACPTASVHKCGMLMSGEGEMPCCREKAKVPSQKQSSSHSCKCVLSTSPGSGSAVTSAFQFSAAPLILPSAQPHVLEPLFVEAAPDVPIPCDLSPPDLVSVPSDRAPPVL